MIASFSEFYSELSGETPPRLLGDHTVILLLDRSLSPAGARKLRDARCAPRTGQTLPWPNPGVYSIPELAERLLRVEEQNQQRRLFSRRDFSALRQIETLLRSETTRSPLQALRLARESIKNLAPLGISFEDWKNILAGFESDGDPDFKSWTQKILAYLMLEGEALQSGEWLSPWSLVREALPLLKPGRPWEPVTERPSLTKPLEFFVPETCEAFPLEEKFLQRLEKTAIVHRVRPAETKDFSAAKLRKAWPESVSDRDVALLWFSFDPLPASAEVAELIPGRRLLDAAEAPSSQSREQARALFLAADFLEHQSPDNHPFLRGPLLRGLSEEYLGKPSTLELNYGELREAVLLHRPDLRSTLSSENFSGPASDWIKVFFELGFFEDSSENPPEGLRHPRLSPEGTSVLSLGDLGLTGHSKIVLWGTVTGIQELCDPQSPEVLKQRRLPSQLSSLMEAMGYRLPDPSREAVIRAGLIHELSDRISVLPQTQVTHGREAEPNTFQMDLKLDHRAPSPSAVESWFKCSMRFALERLLKLESSEEWDAVDENALKMGSWIHRALEKFFDSPDWEAPHALISRILESTRDEFFLERSTPSYLKILSSRGALVADQLVDHIERFERPLAELRRNSKPLRELKVQGTAFGQKFRGIVDRIDILPDGRLLLWDYKTGFVRESKAESQFKQGRFQWFLYRELLKPDNLGEIEEPTRTLLKNARIAGGGYLNPLEPKKSSLFIFEDQAQGLVGILETLFKNNKQPFQLLTPALLDKAEASLRNAMDIVLSEMREGTIRPVPHKPSECAHCSQVALCGRPYLEEGAS